MSLIDRWKRAKKDYDAEYKENQKERVVLEKDIKKLMKDGENAKKKFKIKTKTKFESYAADRVLTRLEAQELIPFVEKVQAKQGELRNIDSLKPRKTIGAEPAFKEIDNVLEVGKKLINAGVEDRGKWKTWHKLAISGLKKCAAAEKKFEKHMGVPRRGMAPEAEVDLYDSFDSILRKMQEKGTPLMRAAGTFIEKDA